MKQKKEERYSPATKQQLKDLRQYENALDYTWGGKSRLMRLCTSTTNVKFGKAEFLFKESLKKIQICKYKKMIAMMYRAYAAVIKEVEDLGYKFLLPNVKCFNFEDNIWYVTDYDYQVPRMRAQYQKEGEKIGFTSIQELFRTIPKEMWDLRLDIAHAFAGAKFEAIQFENAEAKDVERKQTKTNK